MVSSPARVSCASLIPLLAVLLAASGCGGGGGGGTDEPAEFIGGSGTGAGGVPIFWWRYGGDSFGAAGGAVEAAGGGYVACGTMNRLPINWDPAQNDACLIRVDALGRVVWQHNYGLEQQWDGANDVIATADGGFAFAGLTTGTSGETDAYVVKTNADGLPQFECRFGDEWIDEAFALIEIPGGLLVAGSRTHDAGGPQNDGVLAWIDSGGTLVSQKYYGGPSYDRIDSLLALPGGGYVFCGLRGTTPGFTGNEVWLVETDASGNVLWERTFGEGRAASVARLADGGFVITGSVPDPAGATDCLVLCTDPAGNELWRRTFGGPDQDGGEGICVTHTNQILVSGVTQSYTSGTSPWERQDVYLLKLDADGTVVWQKVKGRWPESSDLAASIRETSDGGMLFCGATGAHLMVAKADANGDTIVLGDLDVTIEVPNVVPGQLNFYNAAGAARNAVEAVMNLREAGPFATDMFARVLGGDTSGDICGLGGSMSIVPTPTLPLAAGQGFVASFQSCTTGPAPGTEFAGGYTLDLVQVIGNPTTLPYQFGAILGIDVAVTDDVGQTSFAGDLVFSRVASSTTLYDDQTQLLSGSTIEIATGGNSILLSQATLTSGLSGNLYYLGPASLLAAPAYPAVPLTITIPAANRLTGPVRDAPSSGWMTATAPDGSWVRVTATGNGMVRLDLDTDADGTIDLSLPMSWENLD